MDLSPRDSRGADPVPTTDWIADATRRLAGVSAAEADRGDDLVDRMRAAVAAGVSALPRRSRVVVTGRPGVTITELALTKAITAALSDGAGEESAAIADVDLTIDSGRLLKVTVHLVAVDADQRTRTLLDAGDRLRTLAADVVARTAGAGGVRVDLVWEDLLTSATTDARTTVSLPAAIAV
ncbi:hypothetical protein [Tsukamurella serpentis]